MSEGVLEIEYGTYTFAESNTLFSCHVQNGKFRIIEQCSWVTSILEASSIDE
jgi:hypothetical protein